MINFGLTIDELNLDRRDMLRLGISAGMLPMLAGNSAATPAGDVPDMSSSDSRLGTHVKLMGSTEEITIYLLLEGTLWGVAPGRSPEAICGFRGLARSDWKPLSGNAFSQRSFDIGFFSDLKTGEPLLRIPSRIILMSDRLGKAGKVRIVATRKRALRRSRSKLANRRAMKQGGLHGDFVNHNICLSPDFRRDWTSVSVSGPARDKEW